MKVATAGGPPVTLTPLSAAPVGASWGADDRVIFATANPTTGLLRVAADGGEPEVLTTPNRGTDHWWPEVLPGGNAVLFTITTAATVDNAQIAVLDLTTGDQKILIRGGSHARYVFSGHLVYGLAGTLRAVAFDLDRLEVIGTPVAVLEQVMTTLVGAANVSISGGGALIYISGGAQTAPPGETLVWVDRDGREEPIKVPPMSYRYPRLSPDGTRLAVAVRGQGDDIWVWDFARETLTRVTFEPGQDQYPVWTPDGRRLLFRSERSGPPNLFSQAADGTGAVERLTESANEQTSYAVSPDGTRLVFCEDLRATGQDLNVLTLQGERRAEPLVQTGFTERDAEISPDGRWLAYESNESGRPEIYVRPFPDVNTGRWQISTGGGRTPCGRVAGKSFSIGPPTERCWD